MLPRHSTQNHDNLTGAWLHAEMTWLMDGSSEWALKNMQNVFTIIFNENESVINYIYQDKHDMLYIYGLKGPR